MEDENTGLNAGLDELLRGKTAEQISGPNGVLKQLTKALLQRAMHAELSHHLGYEKGETESRGSGNNRNGSSRKRVQGDFGWLEIAVPRDRNGSFEPQILAKHKRRWTGFDDKIIWMYARGMSTRDIEARLREVYGVDVSATLISQVKKGTNRENSDLHKLRDTTPR